MVKSYIDIALPEESAGVAYQMVKENLITPFMDWVGEGRIREHDWSLKGRIQTNGQVIQETIEMAGSDKNAILVKGPGITPTRDQTVEYLKALNDDRSPEDLSKLVTGTPNGYLRGHFLVKGNIERYENPGLSDLLDVSLPDYTKAGKVEVMYPEGGRAKDGFFHILDQDADVWVECNGQVVRAKEKLSKGSAVYAKTTSRQEVIDLAQKAVKAGKEIVFMSKYTVRPELDGEKKKIYNDVREQNGLERKDGNQRDIVDAAFAYLLSKPQPQDMVAFVPDPSYGFKIAKVVDAVYKKGVKKSQAEFSVCRFCAGKSEYGGLNSVAKQDSEYRLFIGKQDFRFLVKAGDMFEQMHYDYLEAQTYVRQVFATSFEKKYDQVVFAFDQNDPYDQPVLKAVEHIANELKKTLGKEYFIHTPADTAIMMFTKPMAGKTCYAYDNLWGDIVADAMDFGASIASVNSVILLSDGRIWPEMGGAGTAPAKMLAFKKEGFWRYNPMPIIEGLSIGMVQASKCELNNEKLSKYGYALHEAYLTVLKKGFATTDLVTKLKNKNAKGVDMESFIKAVRVELASLLGLHEEALAQQDLLNQTIREIR